jgi:Flp pilus assembly protein TadG
MTMKNRQHSRDRSLTASDAGQGTLELALCLPLFALLILGSAEIGNLAWSSVQLNNAARAGAAFGSISRANAADLADIRTAAYNEAPNFITSPSTQVTPTQVCTCVDSSGTPGAPDRGCTSTNLTSCPSPSVIQVAVQVNVQVPVTPFIHYLGLPATYTVNAQATMDVEQ